MALLDPFAASGSSALGWIYTQQPVTSRGQPYASQPSPIPPQEQRPSEQTIIRDPRVTKIYPIIFTPGQPTQEIPFARGEKPVQPSEIPFGGIFTGIASLGAGAGDFWEKTIAKPYAGYVQPLQKQGPVFSTLGTLASWTVGFPGEIVKTTAMIPGGVAVLAARPQWIPGAVGYAATQLGTEAVKDPLGTAYKFAVTYAAMGAVMEGVPKIYSGLQPRVSEVGVLLRSPLEQWGAIRASFNLFKDVYGIESRLRAEPNLGMVGSIGPGAAPAMRSLITEQTHSIFGRATEIGQMPESWISSRGFTYDLDIFAANKAALTTGARPILGERTAFLDIHPFPEKYPIGISEGLEEYARTPAVNPLPKSTEDLLFGRGLTQEKLYIQAQRKLTSVIGEKETMTRWNFGPPEYRLKDVFDGMRETAFLKGELEYKISQMSSLNLPGKILGDFKAQRMGRDITTLKNYFGKPEVYQRYLEGEIYGPAIRDFNIRTGAPALQSQFRGEPSFAMPKGYKYPFEPTASGIFDFVPSTLASMGSSFRSSMPSGYPSGYASLGPRSSPHSGFGSFFSSLMSSSFFRSSKSYSTPTYRPPSPPYSPPTYRPPSMPPSRPPYSPPTYGPPSPPYSPPTYRPPSMPPISFPPSPPIIPPMTFYFPKPFQWSERKLFYIPKGSRTSAYAWRISNLVPTLKSVGLGTGRWRIPKW